MFAVERYSLSDSPGQYSVLIGTKSGWPGTYFTPEVFDSISPFMMVRFTSDGSVTKSGFDAEISIKP